MRFQTSFCQDLQFRALNSSEIPTRIGLFSGVSKLRIQK